ncbi:hypothetical protein C7I36_00645 [Zobellella taiwanensis]|uniref:Uncharacterized protein n=1 Tax=Zobellella taiwanensis TaxID=347535 RepID=A0A2P7RDR9_9GAMM|nr:glycosyltransferase family 4 protein [Zobellella taiwanensis]PSJ48363.1 hypothetical protein C7I36_00645 [Zobellella taiwanensis]
MHILTPVFFNAPMGGLHENIYASACFMLSKGHQVTIICKPGPFSEKLRKKGIQVIETDFSLHLFSEILTAIETLHSKQPIDLIHAHPFISRQLGFITSQILGLPFLVTLHGKYIDELPKYIGKTDAIFTVSEGIRNYLLNEGRADCPEKIHIIPNTPDSKLFKKVSTTPTCKNEKRVTIALVTRLDKDKSFILEVFYQAVIYAAEKYPERIHWYVVGQGTLQNEMAEKLEALRGKNQVTFTGWLQDEALRDAYYRSDAAIAPGRCALEAMSCGVPVIALGSKNYTGLIGPQTWQKAVFTNFGGVGNKQADYIAGSIEADLDTLMHSAKSRHQLGKFCRNIVFQFFNDNQTHQRLLGHYQIIRDAYQAQPRPKLPRSNFLEMRLQRIHIKKSTADKLQITLECEEPETLQFAWYIERDKEIIEKRMYQPNPKLDIKLEPQGQYRVQCYIRDQTGQKASLWISSDTQYQQQANIKTYLNHQKNLPKLNFNINKEQLG